METIKLKVDTTFGRRAVKFTGVRLGGVRTTKNPNDSTRGATEREYRAQDGRHILHVTQWIGQPDNPKCYMLKEVGSEPDFPPSEDASELDRRRILTLDEALSLSLPAKWMTD